MESKKPIWILVIVAAIAAIPYIIYQACRIEVPSSYMAILTHKTGKDLEPNMMLAKSIEYKGLQLEPLSEGRYYYNPYEWDWQVVPQVEIREGQLGVRIRLYGKDLPHGQLVAKNNDEKGIVAKVLLPGRYRINALVVDRTGQGRGAQSSVAAPERENYAEIIELYDIVTVPAGNKGLLTELAADMPKQPNQVVSDDDRRGVQSRTLEPGSYYINPYVQEVRLIDCRSQRHNLKDIGFPTKDGFWVSLEGIIEFRVKPETAATTYILYNEEREGKLLAEEVIAKVILPNARAYTRLRGSNHSGKEFITGNTRVTFQEDFQKAMKSTCDDQGIEVIQALITSINPPEKIADPVRRRQIALQQETQYRKEMEQQAAERELAVQRATVLQRRELVEASQTVVVVTTEARQKQEVALIDANKRLAVAEQKLLAAKDQAAAILAKGKAAAEVVLFANEAEAAGWRKSIAAFSGNGAEFARWTLFKKIAPAFRSLMINTDNSPLMDIFKMFDAGKKPEKPNA
jgi:regulator of protease activity HflC (stomatin/prohibitin superfamily)